MSLLGSVLGFGSSFLPEVLNFFKQNQAHKHNMDRLKLETELLEKRSALRLDELDKTAEIEETKGLYEHDRTIDAGGFINALRGSVRPVITYFFFLMFVATEIVIILKVLESGNDWMMAVDLLWTEETQGLFAAVMSFWFGSRAVSKYVNK
mgnify:FL=1